MANTFNLGNGNWAQKTEKLLAYNAENDNYKPLPFDFDRASTATRVNKQGLIETVGVDEPRIDFTDNSKGHLLLEPSRRNIMTDSELSTTTITETGDGASSDVTLSNGLSGKQITITSSGRVFAYFTATVVSGTQYTISAFVEDYTGTAASNFIDILSGGSGEDFSSNLIENGRMQGTFTATSTTVGIRIGFGTTSTFSGTYSAKISGIQLEDAGSGSNATYATSYIPTSGSAVTRSAETAIDSGNTNVINSTEGVLYAEIEGFISTDIIEPNRYITITNNTSNERVALLLGGNTNQLRAIVYSNTQSINLSFTTSLTDVKQFNKLAVKYKSGDYAFFLNGTKIGSSTETNIFTANTLNDISFDVGGGTQQFRGKTKDVRVYNTALTDAELIALTS